MKTKVFDQLSHKERKILEISFFLLLYMICTIGYTFFSFRSNAIQGIDDLNFHLGRVRGMEDIIKSPINFKTFGAVGYPINLFYGWITIYPMYLLTKVFGQLVMGYNIYFFLLTFATFIICHFSFDKVIKNSFGSCLFSLCYTMSTYRSMDIYSRAAVGESISLSLIPLIFCSFYLLITKKNHPWKTLAVSMSLLIYSHVLSTILASAYLFVIFSIYMSYKIYYQIKNKIEFDFLEIVKNLFKAVMMTLLLSCFFYLPMFEQFRFQSLSLPQIYSLDSTALLFGTQLIEGALNNDFQSRSIGIVLFVFLIILFFKFKEIDLLAKLSFLIACFSLFLSTNLFPWSILQKTKLNIIQFPWRVNGFSSFFIAIAFSIFISSYIIAHGAWIKKGLIALAAGIFLCTINYASIVNLRHDVATLPYSEEVVIENIIPKIPPRHPPDYLAKNLHSKINIISEKQLVINGNKVNYDHKHQLRLFNMTLILQKAGSSKFRYINIKDTKSWLTGSEFHYMTKLRQSLISK